MKMEMRRKTKMTRNKNKYIFRRYTYLLIGVFFFGNIWAQENEYINNDDLTNHTSAKETSILQNQCLLPTRHTLNTTMIAAGSANMYDTYLSPLEYDGFSIRVINERMRDTFWFNGKFRKQQVMEAEFASGQSPARNVREYWGKIRYQLGGHYLLHKQQTLQLSAGGYWDITAAGLYNERNGNNPATGRIYTNLNLSVMASYKWNKMALRWQIDTPFAGMLFSPKYGQSYYEMSLGNTVGIVNFASFHNQRALRNFITVDLAFSKYILRLGYLGDWYQTKVNNIITHHYTHSFVIGFPLEGIMKKKEKARNSYWN